MISYFYTYLKNVVLFLLFVTFLQTIIPTKKYANYIQLIFGIILIFIMLNPLKDFLTNFKKVDFDKFYDEIFDTYKLEDYNIEEYYEIKNEIVLNAYKDNIKNKLEKEIGNKYDINDIIIDLEKDKKDDIFIKKLNIYLNIQNTNSYDAFDNEEIAKDKQNVKNIVSNFYNIDIDNIFIEIT